MAALILFFKSHVKGYTRKDGTYVKDHENNRQKKIQVDSRRVTDSLEPENKPRLAPNGKPSNLNAMQHAQVRTPEFKGWFGDWETSARQSFLREYFTKALNDNQWQSRIVIAEGANADPSGRLSEIFGFKVIKQLSSPDDIRKTNKVHGEGNERKQDQIGLTVDDYIKAIEVLRNPESFKKTISNNGKPSAEFGRRFSDGTIVVAEVETAEDGAVAVKSVWKKIPGRIHADGTIYLNRTSENTAEMDDSISSNDLIVNPDSVSKVIDENGEPLVVYHGTPDGRFTEFREDKQTSNTKFDDSSGFFFTPDKKYAESYADWEDEDSYIERLLSGNDAPNNANKDIKSVYLRIINPIDANTGHKGSKEIFNAAKENGNDGVFSNQTSNKMNEIVAFNPSQIKSATGNSGGFSKKSNDMHKALFFGNTAEILVLMKRL